MATPTTVRTRASEETAQRWLVEFAHRRERAGDGRGRGDIPFEELRSRIAAHYAPLVESVARRFLATGEPLDDLVQEGYLGLLSALEHWDPSRGVKFTTYAVHFIAGTIRHFLRDKCRPIREPAWVHALARRIDEVSQSLTHTLHRTPTPEELAAELQVPVEQVKDAISARSRAQTLSLTESEGDGAGDGVELDRLLAQIPPVQRLVEDRILLEKALAALKPREQQVVYEFFFRDLNQVEIARKIGVSPNYVSVTLRKATDRLRRLFLEAEVLDRTRGRESSILDPVTGLYAPEHVRARLVEGVSRAARSGEPFGVVAFDLSALPTLARRQDDVLRACGATVRGSIRRTDVGGRWSETTLVTLLPGAGSTSSVVADRLTPLLLKAAVESGNPVEVTTRTVWYPELGRTARELIGLLDPSEAVEPLPLAA